MMDLHRALAVVHDLERRPATTLDDLDRQMLSIARGVIADGVAQEKLKWQRLRRTFQIEESP